MIHITYEYVGLKYPEYIFFKHVKHMYTRYDKIRLKNIKYRQDRALDINFQYLMVSASNFGLTPKPMKDS